MKKICAGCGVEYEGRSNSIYCSRKCKNKSGYKPRPLEKKICAGCGKEYETAVVRQKFCSEACRVQYFNKRRAKAAFVKKICAECGAEFETNKSYQKYCSDKCRDRAWGNYSSKPPPEPAMRHCLACGSEYEPKFNNDRFCSDDCRMSWYRPEVINAIGKIFYARQ